MPRTFDGANDSIHTSIGACGLTGAFTVACVVRRANNTNYHNLCTPHTSGGTAAFGLEIEDSSNGNGLQVQVGGSFAISTFTVTSSDSWVIVAGGKDAGTAMPRVHKYVYSTGTWTHEGTVTNLGNPGSTAGGTVRFGEWEGVDDLDGDLAAAAVFDRNLTDTEVEQLAHSLLGWYSLAPVGMWLFDQQATGQNVVDLVGGGANQSAITGTSVASSSLPGLSYGHEILVPHSIPAGGADATATPASTAATVSLPSATVSAGSTTTPAAIAAVVTLPAASKSAGSTATPAATATTVALPAASVTAAVTETPAAIAAVVNLPAAAAGAAVVVAPQPVAVAVSLPAAAVSAGATVTPATIAATVALPASTRSLGQTVAPATIAATVALPPVTVQAGGSATVSPSPIAAVASLPALVLSASSTVAPSVFATSVALPAAATVLGVIREPAAVAATVSLPASSRLIGAGPSPATIAALVTVPAVTIPGQEDAVGSAGRIVASSPTGRITASTPSRYTTSKGGGRQ